MYVIDARSCGLASCMGAIVLFARHEIKVDALAIFNAVFDRDNGGIVQNKLRILSFVGRDGRLVCGKGNLTGCG